MRTSELVRLQLEPTPSRRRRTSTRHGHVRRRRRGTAGRFHPSAGCRSPVFCADPIALSIAREVFIAIGAQLNSVTGDHDRTGPRKSRAEELRIAHREGMIEMIFEGGTRDRADGDRYFPARAGGGDRDSANGLAWRSLPP